VNTTIPPTDPAETIRLWLNPRFDDEEAVVTYLITTMRRQLPALAHMLSREFREAMRAAGSTARHECLDAVQAVIDEIEGKQR
jgi:hypothetical protein